MVELQLNLQETPDVVLSSFSSTRTLSPSLVLHLNLRCVPKKWFYPSRVSNPALEHSLLPRPETSRIRKSWVGCRETHPGLDVQPCRTSQYIPVLRFRLLAPKFIVLNITKEPQPQFMLSPGSRESNHRSRQQFTLRQT